MYSRRNEKYEELMEKIGDFGTFQKRLCFLLVLSTVPNGYFAMLIVFVGRTPSYRCFIPGIDDVIAQTEGNSTWADYSVWNTSSQTNLTNTSHHTWNDTAELPYNDECNISSEILGNASQNSTPGEIPENSTNCPYGIVYDFEEGRSSIVSEWDLVCSKAWIMPLITSIYMSGVLIGSITSGILSDKYGRFPVFLAGTLLMFVFLALCGLSTSPAMFAGFLFFAGAFGYINYVTAFVLAAEMINSKHRVVTGILTVGGFAGGYMLLPLFAYYIPNWRTLCFILASLGVMFIPYIWLMSESSRWLFSKGRKEDFIKLFRKIAKANGVSEERTENLIQDFFNDLENSPGEKLLDNHDNSVDSFRESKTVHEYSCFDLLRYGVVRVRTLIMWFTWFVCSVVYFGVGFNTSNMGGNPYINCFVAAAVEIPAYALVIALLKWQGRKPILIATLIIAGLTCSAVPYLKTINADASIGFAMIGKLAVSGSFGIVYIYCSELFPTLMRSMSVGSSSMAARVGGMVAPYLLYLGRTHESIPYLAMGILSLIACVCNAVLPETKDTPLPESIEDLEPIRYFACLKSSSKKQSEIEDACCAI